MKKYSVGIIGGGPSGVTASIYLKRAGIDFVLFENYMIGGKVNLTATVDNYPPFKNISGSDLAFSYMEDLQHNDIEVTYEDVEALRINEDKTFEVKTSEDTYNFKAVLICTGTKDKTLNIPSENKYMHRGISFCAVCDGNLFKNKPMCVVGGGNSSLEEALYLSSIAEKVYVIHRRDEFRGSKQYLEKLQEKDNVEILTPYVVEEFLGESSLEKIRLKHRLNEEEKIIDVNACFIYVGSIPNTQFVEAEEIKNKEGYIEVDSLMRTKVPGLFASGDCTNKPLRQIVIASGDGALATNSIIEYLRN